MMRPFAIDSFGHLVGAIPCPSSILGLCISVLNYAPTETQALLILGCPTSIYPGVQFIPRSFDLCVLSSRYLSIGHNKDVAWDT